MRVPFPRVPSLPDALNTDYCLKTGTLATDRLLRPARPLFLLRTSFDSPAMADAERTSG